MRTAQVSRWGDFELAVRTACAGPGQEVSSLVPASVPEWLTHEAGLSVPRPRSQTKREPFSPLPVRFTVPWRVLS
ncbi:hypothetical protein C8Q76DRAFT_761971 [Earliella scabrosa]|nr:hypothetical protein C8Q76DRAFT_761971 [Earliella scabrosa]